MLRQVPSPKAGKHILKACFTPESPRPGKDLASLRSLRELRRHWKGCGSSQLVCQVRGPHSLEGLGTSAMRAGFMNFRSEVCDLQISATMSHKVCCITGDMPWGLHLQHLLQQRLCGS